MKIKLRNTRTQLSPAPVHQGFESTFREHDARQVMVKADLVGNYEANMQARERPREEWKENLK